MSLTEQEKELLFEEFKAKLTQKQTIYIETENEIPNYSNIGDAGMDIRSTDDILILPNETKVIPTGIKVAVPEGYEIQIRPRSGISLKTPLRIPNSPGTIDSGYRDSIGVIVTNTSIKQENDTPYLIGETGNKQGAYLIRKGDRIAQMVLVKHEVANFVLTDDVKKYGSNRNGAFGSTGIK